jgi:hypothetical protein
MANNQQPQGGNSIAALLGNMRGPAQFGQQQPQAAYGGGLQPPTMGARGMPADLMSQMGYGQGPQPMQAGAPYESGGGGVPQARQGPAPGGPMQAAGGQGWAAGQPGPSMDTLLSGAGGGPPKTYGGMQPGGFRPMPSFGAPGAGAGGGKGPVKQAIGQLPGAPPMGGAMRPMRRPRAPGMQANPALMRQGR